MKIRKTCMLPVLILSVAAASTAFAGGIPEKFNFSPTAGVMVFDGNLNLDTAATIGAKLGYDFTKQFGIDFGYGYAFSNTDIAGGGFTGVSHYNLDLLYHIFPEGKFSPYLAAGYGGLNFMSDNSGLNVKKGAFDYGAGFRYYFNDSVAFRADARHLIASLGQTTSNFELSAGLLFPFETGPCACPNPATPAPPAPKPLVKPVPPPAPVAAPKPAPVVMPVPAPKPVIPAPTARISASPASVVAGTPTTVSWSSTNAKECDVQPGVGTVAPQGSRQVTLQSDTNYSIVCSGEGGKANSAARVAVTQPPKPECNIAAEPASIEKGKESKLSWSSKNASECDLQPEIGKVELQGDKNVAPSAETKYTLACKGAGGTAQSETSVKVTEPLPCETITLNIKFDSDKSVVKPKFNDEMKKLSDYFTKYPKATAAIEGHTDNVGNAKYNQALSQKRADAVRSYLIDKFKVDGGRVTAKGYGLEKPIADNKTAAGKAKNRRIETQLFCNQ